MKEFRKVLLDGLDDALHRGVPQDGVYHAEDTSFFLGLQLEGQGQLLLLVEGQQDIHEEWMSYGALLLIHSFGLISNILDGKLICFDDLLRAIEEADHTEELVALLLDDWQEHNVEGLH